MCSESLCLWGMVVILVSSSKWSQLSALEEWSSDWSPCLKVSRLDGSESSQCSSFTLFPEIDVSEDNTGIILTLFPYPPFVVVVQLLSCAWLFVTLMGCSMPGFLVFHYLLEFAQTQVHWVGDTIQPSHPLWPPSPPALSLSQHQGLFQWVSSFHQVAKVLEL